MYRIVIQVFMYLVLIGNVFPHNQIDIDHETAVAVKEALRIFVDCDECDFNFIRLNIPFVNFTRDSKLAQVHIIISINNTGSGGHRYNISFIGRENFSDLNQELQYISAQSDSKGTINEGLTRILKMGLMPYVSQTKTATDIDIKYHFENGSTQEREAYDPWNAWIFNIDFSGALETEESQNEITLVSSFEADRTTENWKFRSDFEYEYQEENFEDDGKKIKSILKQSESDIKTVKSIDNHWAMGILTGANTSTYKNIELKLDFAPAIEYNFFPWDILDRKIFTTAYQIGIRTFNYIEETIYNKQSEILSYEALRFELELREPWGEVDASLEGSHFFKNLKYYHVELAADVSFRLTKGFSIAFDVEAESIHNQIYLAKGNASLEEILLKRRQLSTDYDVRLSLGIRYTFGSIYNNIVNRRL